MKTTIVLQMRFYPGCKITTKNTLRLVNGVDPSIIEISYTIRISFETSKKPTQKYCEKMEDVIKKAYEEVNNWTVFEVKVIGIIKHKTGDK